MRGIREQPPLKWRREKIIHKEDLRESKLRREERDRVRGLVQGLVRESEGEVRVGFGLGFGFYESEGGVGVREHAYLLGFGLYRCGFFKKPHKQMLI